MLDNFRIRLSSLGPVMLRVALGAVFIFHGWDKFAGLFKDINPVAGVVGNWPFAEYFGWAAGTTEFVGGICVVLGLATRFWSAGLVIQMAVAIAAVHGANGFALNPVEVVVNGKKFFKLGFEYPFTLGLMALGLFLLGPGPLSLDYLFGKLIRGPRANSVIGCGSKGLVCPAAPEQDQPARSAAAKPESTSGNG